MPFRQGLEKFYQIEIIQFYVSSGLDLYCDVVRSELQGSGKHAGEKWELT